MDYYGGFNGRMAEKSKELLGASKLARQWAKEMKSRSER
jgi:hypothetical protein